MLYFAYGSNMLRERISHPRRAPGATWLGSGYVLGRELVFHKHSRDGSGKCDLRLAGDLLQRAYGVLYQVPEEEVPALDRAEAVGAGYQRERIEVVTAAGQVVLANIYLATPAFINPQLLPYTWYKELVLQGARRNQLPVDLIRRIAATPALPDPEPDRPAAIEAAEVLQACVPV